MLTALGTTSAVLGLIFHLAWKTQGRVAHALTWSFACLAMTIQCCVMLGSAWFPSFETYWIAVNGSGLAVVTLALHGHCQRTECKIVPHKLWPFAAAILAMIAWFTVIAPHVGLRSGILPLTGAVTLFLSTAIVLRQRSTPRPADFAAAAAMALFGFAQLAAAAAALMQGAGGDAGYAALNRSINLLSLPVGYIGVAVFAMLMLTSDLSGHLKAIAVRDQLTGLLNRRGFGEQAARAYSTARRIGHSVSVIMSDIDRFKSINDEFGHAAGDKALCHIATIFEQDRRAEDILARMGGEEFALVLPGTGVAETMRIATELCSVVERTILEIDGQTVAMTASFGIATISDKDTCLTDIIVRADKALYRSKRAGRNRVDLDSSQVIRLPDGPQKQHSA
jgi:diguanylate cyclase (GGDEF)-like protein